MTREQAEQTLDCAMTLGEQLQLCGAEVSRVEDTIRRICLAYGAVRTDVFCITSSIVATLFLPDGGTCTQTRRVQNPHNDLGRLDRLNQLSREICRDTPGPQEVREALKRVDSGPSYSWKMQLAIYALISGSFSVFFGGDLHDMIASTIIGVLLKLLESAIRREVVNGLLTALLCASAGGLLSSLAVRVGLGHHTDLISIGNIMLFIPGIAFTNSLRDLFSGDTITGLIRFSESILLAIIVALGFALVSFAI